MNLIDYNQAMEALEKERQYLLNREQYEAENVLVHHAVNVIAELKIVRQPEIIMCKDCKHYDETQRGKPKEKNRHYVCDDFNPEDDWFCADGELR